MPHQRGQYGLGAMLIDSSISKKAVLRHQIFLLCDLMDAPALRAVVPHCRPNPSQMPNARSSTRGLGAKKPSKKMISLSYSILLFLPSFTLTFTCTRPGSMGIVSHAIWHSEAAQKRAPQVSVMTGKWEFPIDTVRCHLFPVHSLQAGSFVRANKNNQTNKQTDRQTE